MGPAAHKVLFNSCTVGGNVCIPPAVVFFVGVGNQWLVTKTPGALTEMLVNK